MDLKRKAMSGALVPVKRPRNELQTFNDRSNNVSWDMAMILLLSLIITILRFANI